MLFEIEKYVYFWKFIQYAIHWDKTNIKKIPFGQINGAKKSFFHELQLITVSLLISDS